jgi:zinc protease
MCIRQVTFTLLVVAMTFATLPARAQKPGAVFPFPYETVTLDNGFTAYLVRAGAPGQVAYLSLVRTGSRDEVEPGKSGFAHLFEHMMFRGTDRYPDYDLETTKLGAFRNGTTNSDWTIYYVVVNAGYLDKVMDIEADRFQRLKYSEADFRTDAGAVLGEQQQGAREPQRILNEKLRETAFTRHPYGHTVIGYEADVRAMPQGYAYSQEFYRRHYRPENVVVVIAGDFDSAATKALLRKYYGGWTRGTGQRPPIPAEPPQTEPRRKVVTYPGRTLPIISISHRAPAFAPADRTAVALEVLGQAAFGASSPIYRKLVLQERRVQTLSPSFDLLRDPYVVTVQTTVGRPEDADAVEAELLAEIARYRDTLVEPSRLTDIKRSLKYGLLMGMESAQDVAFALVQPLAATGRLESLEEYFRTLDAVTPDDVRAAARTYLVDRGRTTIVMVQGS